MSDYCSAATVKLIMGYGSDKDTLLATIVPMVTQVFNTAWDRDIRKSAATELYDGSGSAYIFLKRSPVFDTPAVVVTVDDEILAATDYVIYYPEGIIKRQTTTRHCLEPVFTLGDQNVEITYTAGYEDVAIPKDIELAAVLMTGHLVESKGILAAGLVSERIGNYSYRMGEPSSSTSQEAEKAIPMKIWAMISRYARRDFYAVRR